MIRRHQLKIVISCICLYIFTSISVATAETYQSHNSIYWVVKKYIRDNVTSQHNQKIEVKTGKLDSRLKLNKCNKYLQAFSPKGSSMMGKTTVGVKCPGTKPWSLHVPVTISIYKSIIVSAQQLQKDTILTAADIKQEKHDLADLSYGYFENSKDVIGMKLKRHVLAGTALTPAMLSKRQIVSRGQNVTIYAQSGSMVVRMTGKALDNGAVGERIKVMNIKSRKKLEGIITSTGEIEVQI
ncbi:MAG: flagellar basal body P-ring formation protein FlgA [Gammaproteobacteria bacterium]|nr:flagellar basal body P-ring formation protein FlgA [Gammaproteobacteria bacterium]